MKKLLILLLSVIAVISLSFAVACGGSGEKDFTITSSIELAIDGQAQIQVEVEDKELEITFTSSDTNIITVDENGNITPQNFGTATVKVGYDGQEKSCTVTVKSTTEVPTLTMSADVTKEIKLYVDGEYTVVGGVSFNDKAVNATVSYSSSNTAVATVDANGSVKAVSLGTSEITATATYKKWTITQKYTVKVVSDVQVVLSNNNVKLFTSNTYGAVSEQIDLVKVVVDGQTVNGATVKWTSDNQSVATVNNGLIEKVGEGKTTIRAEYENTDGEKYYGLVLVSVEKYKLANVKKVSISGTVMSWDAVYGAQGYYVSDGESVYDVKDTSIDLKQNDYFGVTQLLIRAYSESNDVIDGDNVSCSAVFETRSLTNQALTKSTYDANITKVLKDKADVEVYNADCTTTNVTAGKFGLKQFKLVSATSKGELMWWVNKKANLLDEVGGKYLNAKITMWVYAEQEITIGMVALDTMFDRTLLASQTVKAGKWTLVSMSIPQSAFTYITYLGATNNFYFTDLRLSTAAYSVEDYADISDVITNGTTSAIDAIGTIDENSGDKISLARDKYNALTDEEKKYVGNYNKLLAAEEEFSEIAKRLVGNDPAVVLLDADIAAFVTDFDSLAPISPDTLKGVLADKNQIDGEYSQLSTLQKYALSNYADYKDRISSFKVINDMVGSNANAITGFGGFVSITGYSSKLAVLNTEKYGPVASVGKSVNKNTVLVYSDKAQLDLKHYTHITFGVINRLSADIDVCLYYNDSRSTVLTAGISGSSSNTTAAQVVMTVEQFLNSHIDIILNASVQGNVWLTPFVAFNYPDWNAQAVDQMINAIGSVDKTKADLVYRARSAYDYITSAEKAKVTKLSTLTAAETSLATLAKAELASDAKVLAVNQKITEFNTSFVKVTHDNFINTGLAISQIDGMYKNLSSYQKYAVQGYSTYYTNKTSFLVLDDMKGKINERFVLGGNVPAKTISNAQNNSIFARGPYGDFIGFGRNASGEVTIDYLNKDKLDLATYTYVSFKIGANCANELQNGNLYVKVGNDIVKQDIVPSGSCSVTENFNKFVTVTMTVEQFLSGPIAIGVHTSFYGSLYITALIAHN